MDRSLISHTILAVVASVIAYVAWTAPKPDKESLVVMVPGTVDKLAHVTWHEDGWNVTLAKEKDGLVVTAAKLEKEGTTPPAPKTFPGSKQADDLFEKLAPLKAGRSLGKLGPEKLTAMGLAEPKSSLLLRSGNTETKVLVGDATYGTSDLYTMLEGGEVFLVPAGTLSSLRNGAATLMDKSLISAKEDQIGRLTVTAPGGGRELVQRFSDDRSKAFFADPAEPDLKLETASNWLNRLLRLRVIELVSDEPAQSPAASVLLFDAKGEKLGAVELFPASEKTALARSSRFKSAVTVSKAEAEAILKDLDSVLTEGK